MRLALTVIASSIILGCSPPEPDLLVHPLRDGGTLASRSAGKPFVVAIVLQPSDVFSCGTPVSRWVEWGRRHPGQLLLVLSRPPTESERKQLLLYRLRPDHVLDVTRVRRSAPPYQYMIASGRVVVAEPLPAGVPESPLLTALERGHAPELLHNRRAVMQP